MGIHLRKYINLSFYTTFQSFFLIIGSNPKRSNDCSITSQSKEPNVFSKSIYKQTRNLVCFCIKHNTIYYCPCVFICICTVHGSILIFIIIMRRTFLILIVIVAEIIWYVMFKSKNYL